MKRKIAFMLVVIVLAVAMFAVPTMAADNEDVSIIRISPEELMSGNPIVVNDSFTVDGETYYSEIEITNMPIKGRGVAPGVMQQEIKNTLRHTPGDTADYGYYRSVYQHNPSQQIMVHGWEPSNNVSQDYFSRGAKGSFIVGTCNTINNAPEEIVSDANFYDSGRAVYVKSRIYYEEGSLVIRTQRPSGYYA